jgi:L-alanine-DL-glutamate epimerase-like enolase superfamily enzyme
MKITAVEVYRQDLPLVTPFQHFASGSVRALEEVYVRLTTDEGVTGLGESRGNSHYLTGDTPDRVVAEILQHLGPRLIGRDPRELHALLAELDQAVVGAHGSRSALDLALHDLVGHAYGVPVFALLGGAVRETLPSNQSIWYGPPDAAARQAAAYVADGFRFLKVRSGLRPFQRDIDRIRAVREAIGPDVSLAIDLNMAWTAREAVRHLRTLEPFDLAYVEQPVPHRDFAGLRHVTQHTDIPIMADESVQSLDDVLLLARDRVVDLLHLKLIKLGGIAGLWRAAAVAETAGIELMVGQTNEGGLATAAAAHCALAVKARYLELYGAEGLVEDPATGFALRRGVATITERPGLGVTLDVSRLRPVGTVTREASR